VTLRRAAVVFAALFALCEVAPYLVMLSGSLKSLEEVSRVPPTVVPQALHPENYRAVFASAPMARYLVNTIVVSGAIAAIQLVLVCLAAYALVFLRAPGGRVVRAVVLVCLLVPPQVRFVPVYVLFARLDLLDTFFALIVPHATSALGILLVEKAMRAVPAGVVEAARLDGASELDVLARVVAPMIRPTLVAFALFSVVYHWNDYFWPLVMTTDDSVRTLPVGVALLREQGTGVRWHVVMAGNVVVTVPILVAFAFAQRHLVRAFTWSAGK
jgi:sn-glycerol 3-phosphate transport system permease protein